MWLRKWQTEKHATVCKTFEGHDPFDLKTEIKITMVFPSEASTEKFRVQLDFVLTPAQMSKLR